MKFRLFVVAWLIGSLTLSPAMRAEAEEICVPIITDGLDSILAESSAYSAFNGEICYTVSDEGLPSCNPNYKLDGKLARMSIGLPSSTWAGASFQHTEYAATLAGEDANKIGNYQGDGYINYVMSPVHGHKIEVFGYFFHFSWPYSTRRIGDVLMAQMHGVHGNSHWWGTIKCEMY